MEQMHGFENIQSNFHDLRPQSKKILRDSKYSKSFDARGQDINEQLQSNIKKTGGFKKFLMGLQNAFFNTSFDEGGTLIQQQNLFQSDEFFTRRQKYLQNQSLTTSSLKNNNLTKWDPFSERRQQERNILNNPEQPSKSVTNNQRKYLIDGNWYEQWLNFINSDTKAPPKYYIDNTLLSSKIDSEGFQQLIRNKDYYELSFHSWKQLQHIYRGGPLVSITQEGKVIEDQDEFTKRLQFNRHVKVLNQSMTVGRSSDRSDYSGFDATSQNGFRRIKTKFIISSSVQIEDASDYGGNLSTNSQRKGSKQTKGLLSNNRRNLTQAIERQKKLPKGIVGIDNQGNNCYMNAVLQCLMQISSLREYMMTNIGQYNINDTPFCQALTRILQLSEGDKAYIVPSVLHKLVHQKFQPILQHDAHEFFIFIVTQLSEELQKLNKRQNSIKSQNSQIKIENSPEQDIDDDMMILDDISVSIPDERTVRSSFSQRIDVIQDTENKWNEYQARNNSFIDSMFTGMFKSIVKCTRCQNQSTTYDPFMVLSIPSIHPTLDQCMATTFHMEEKLQSYFCTKCKQDTNDATLQTLIARTPEVLVIHLKRFQQYPLMKKVKGFIRYPEKISDFSKYCEKGQNKDDEYILSGIIVHWGSLERGHYVSVVRKMSQWFYCNDKNIGECNERVALSQEGYMLFYTKVRKQAVNN